LADYNHYISSQILFSKDDLAGYDRFIFSQIWSDFGLGEFELWYVRDREKREVDALVTRDNQPRLMVEVKLNDLNVSKAFHLKKQRSCIPFPIE
jgi:hypothetical protein